MIKTKQQKTMLVYTPNWKFDEKYEINAGWGEGVKSNYPNVPIGTVKNWVLIARLKMKDKNLLDSLIKQHGTLRVKIVKSIPEQSKKVKTNKGTKILPGHCYTFL